MKVLSVVDSVNSCDCCGRIGLKKTVAVEHDNGDICYYGTTCATKKHLHLTIGQINKACDKQKELYVNDIYQKAKTLPEYKEAIKTEYEARRLQLKFKTRSDFVRPSIDAFDRAIQSLIEGNIYSVQLWNVTSKIAF